MMQIRRYGRACAAMALMMIGALRAQTSPFADITGEWAWQTLNSMSVEEKIGQLLVPAVMIYPDLSDPILQDAFNKIDQTPVEQMVKDYHIGGLLLHKKTTDPAGQIEFTRAIQTLSPIPLLITQDLEWGLSMRLKDVIVFPHNMTLGAIQNDEFIYAMGVEIGRECSLLGVHVNFAPVADVNNNPNNPIINMRSFGENPAMVAHKAELFMRGLRDAGVLSCAKHFPGHGDTEVDSHDGLPCINHSLEHLHEVELAPFKKLIEAGVPLIMVGHLEVPALDATPNMPATLSYPITTEVLRNNMHFDGLIVTDAMNMDGVLKNSKPGEVELKALLAGADIILCSKNNRAALGAIKQALDDGTWSYDELDQRVYKILCAKEWANRQGQVTAPIPSIVQSLHDDVVIDLRQQLYDESTTVVKNEGNILPMVGDISVACLQIQKSSGTKGCFALTRSTNVTHFEIAPDATQVEVDKLLEQVQEFDVVAVGIHGLNNNANDRYGISDATLYFFDALAARNQKAVAVVFGTPYSLQYFKDVPAVVAAYEDEPAAMYAAAQVIFGAHAPHGKLPVTACEQFPAGRGLSWCMK
jgi:beta-N-acetylhexosaminidase